MGNQLFTLFSNLPNFKGKLFLADRLYRYFPPGIGQLERVVANSYKAILSLDDRIQRRMYVRGDHEEETGRTLIGLGEKAKCFLDVGGNIGHFSLLLASHYPHLPIIAFEPLPTNIARFKQNIVLNQFKNILLMEACLSDIDAKVDFCLPPSDECGHGHIRSENKDNFELTPTIQSQAITFDQFYQNYPSSMPLPDLIKIDTEGNELKVLHGCSVILANKEPVIVCLELNEPCLRANHTSSMEIISYMRRYNFKAFAIRKNGRPFEVSSPVENYRYLNYFFSRDSLIYL